MIRFRGNLIDLLKQDGWIVETLTPYDATYTKALGEIADEAHSITMSRWISPYKDMLMCLEFAWFCIRRRRSYQVVHTMTLKPNVFLAPMARLMLARKTRIVGLISGLGSYLSRKIEMRDIQSKIFITCCKIAFGCLDKVWVQNPEDINKLVSNGLLLEDKCILGLGSGISPITREECLDLIDKSYNKRLSDNSAYIFVCAARATREKGILDVVKAAAITDTTPFKIVILAPSESDGTNCLDGIDLPSNVEYIDKFMRLEKVEELVRDCYAVCLPSYYPEGVPRFLLEGLSWGKPVITTANPGCKETINNRSNGFICQARNEEDLSQALTRLISLSKEEYRSFCLNSLGLAEERFSTAVLWSRIKQLYRN